jgi:hypothetical protein
MRAPDDYRSSMSQLGVDTAQCRRHGLPADGFAVAIELEQLGAGVATRRFQPIQTLPTGLSGLPPPDPRCRSPPRRCRHRN